MLVEQSRNPQYSKSFRYNDRQSNYDISIKKRKPWWLLALLLIPFLLLIRCSKDITIVTEDPYGGPVAEASVSLSYVEHQLLKKGQFFLRKQHCLVDKSDSAGRVLFKKVQFGVYSSVFKGREIARAEAEKGKLKGVAEFLFHRQSSDTIVLGWALPIEVRWRSTNAPVSGAQLSINYEDNVKLYSAALVTDEDGACVLKTRTMDGRIVAAAVTKIGTSGTLVFDEHFEDYNDSKPLIIYLDDDVRCSSFVWTSTLDDAWYSIRTFDLGKNERTVKFSYCSRVVPDCFRVFEGTPDMIANQTARLLFSYGNKVDPNMNPHLQPSLYDGVERTGNRFLSNEIHSNSQKITVLVVCEYADATWWEYKVECI